ncbi:MAG: helix-turn-helix domain-containing protein [Anaerolineae bacterium]|nr:helix-turn-helix domain-containing protein [Anaerolineae bacterium]
MLKLSRSKVYQMVERQELPAVRIGRSVRVLKSDLLRWIQEQREDNGNVLTAFGNTKRG